MGILNWFAKPEPAIQQLPSGSFTVDRHGNVMTTTVGSGCSPRLLDSIACEVLSLFRSAREAQMPLTGLDLNFADLQITAREMQGGAIIFISPQKAAVSSSDGTQRA